MALKLYERYLLRELLATSGMVLLAFVALFSFFEFITELASVNSENGYSLWQAFLVSLLRTPAKAYETFPLAVLVGTLYGLSQLAKNSELNVLRVSGVSTQRFLFTLFKMATLFAFLTLLTGEVIAPLSEQMAQELRPRGSVSKRALGVQSGFWFRDGKSFVNIRSVQTDAKLKDVVIYDFDAENRLIRVLSASEGNYLPPGSWHFKDIVQTDYLPNAGAVTRQLPELIWASELSPDMLGVLNVLPERLSVFHLGGYIRHLAANQQNVERYEIAFWRKLVYPLSVFVMVALALPFAFVHNRVAGMGLKIFAGVMIGVAFYMLNGLSASIGLLNHWPTFIAAVAPLCLFMLLAAALLWTIDRR